MFAASLDNTLRVWFYTLMPSQETPSNSITMPGLSVVRMALEISRPKLGKAVGCHPNTVQNIENHSRVASLELANKLAQHFCCRVDDLINPPDKKRLKEITRAYHLKLAEANSEESGAA